MLLVQRSGNCQVSDLAPDAYPAGFRSGADPCILILIIITITIFLVLGIGDALGTKKIIIIISKQQSNDNKLLLYYIYIYTFSSLPWLGCIACIAKICLINPSVLHLMQSYIQNNVSNTDNCTNCFISQLSVCTRLGNTDVEQCQNIRIKQIRISGFPKKLSKKSGYAKLKRICKCYS